MTISKDLFLAILSMDAYNRGYNAGISDGSQVDSNGVDHGLGDAIGTKIGNAEIVHRASSDPNSAEVAAGFYALAYELTGSYASPDGTGLAAGDTVISYRG